MGSSTSQRWRNPSASGALVAVAGRVSVAAGGRGVESCAAAGEATPGPGVICAAERETAAMLPANRARTNPGANRRRLMVMSVLEKCRIASGPLEQPAFAIAVGTEAGECGLAAADSRERHWRAAVGHGFRHDAIRAIGQLIDPPQLLGRAGECCHGLHFPSRGCGQCAIGTG